MRIAIVVQSLDFLLSHRLEICIASLDAGHEVHIVSSYNKEVASKLNKMNIIVHSIVLNGNGKNPIEDLKTIFGLKRMFKLINPDLVHLITIKPQLYGGMVSRIVRVPAIVSAVPGLGVFFSSSKIKYKFLRVLLYPIYKFAFSHNNQKFIFQNPDDKNTLLGLGLVKPSEVEIIRGSGVDLSKYIYTPEPNGIPVVSIASRLIASKGIEIFIKAAKEINNDGIKAQFWVIGERSSGNKNSISKNDIIAWKKYSFVDFLGYRDDIPNLFSKSNIVVLPSFFNEGLPKVLIEAAACGRAVITTDHTGCRDAIEPDTGILIPIKNYHALADAIKFLIDNPKKRKDMGIAGRALANREFDVNSVVEKHMKIYSILSKTA